MIIYWISILFIDFIKFLFLMLLIYPFLLWKNEMLIYSLIIVIFFIISCCLFNYVLSNLFSEELSGQKFSLLINYLIFLGFLGLDFGLNTDSLIPPYKKEGFSFFFSDLCPTSEFGLSMYKLSMYGYFKYFS